MTPEAYALKIYAGQSGHRPDPRAALIDMDGVLYDSMPRHADAWMRMTSRLGMPCRREEFFLYEGMTGRDTIRLLMRKYFGREATAEECERLYARKTALFAANPQRPLMPGADRMLCVLSDFGLRRVLVTGSGQASLLNALSHDYPGVFTPENMVTAADVEHGKPHPEPYLRGLERAGCDPWQAIVIENAPLGVQSGAAAGCLVVAVATGPIPPGKLTEAGAHIVYNSMQECADGLPALLEQARQQAEL